MNVCVSYYLDVYVEYYICPLSLSRYITSLQYCFQLYHKVGVLRLVITTTHRSLSTVYKLASNIKPTFK